MGISTSIAANVPIMTHQSFSIRHLPLILKTPQNAQVGNKIYNTSIVYKSVYNLYTQRHLSEISLMGR